MATQLGDTLTTRDALRRATVDDILARAEVEGTEIEGGLLDGVKVVSMGKLRDIGVAHLQVDLPPPSDKYAEVSTPASLEVSAFCPECHQPVTIGVALVARLTVEGNSTELSVKAVSKSRPHMHGQQPLPVGGEDQETIDGQIEDLRLRILGAVYDLEAERDDPDVEGPEVTLELIGNRLQLATDGDRGDLEESLYAYSQADPPMVEVETGKGHSPYYSLTDDGARLVTDARAEAELDPSTLDPDEGEDDVDPDGDPD